MKTFIKIISSVLLIPFFVILLLSVTIKFQILNDQFWLGTFDKYDIYSSIKIEVDNYLNDKNANIFSDLTTRENIKDFTDKNIVQVVGFVNGRSEQLTFYIPVSKIPKELLPKKIGTITEQMTAQDLIQKFNIGGIDMLVIDQFKNIGRVVDYIFYTAIVLTVFVLVFSYPLTLGIIGILMIVQRFFISNFSIQSNLITETMANFVILEISNIWSIIGVVLIAISLAIFFVQKIKKGQNGQV